ncbi:helicase RepA family protein [Mesorhizobium sp. M1312]
MEPSPFRWRDPAAIEPREWLYGHHLIRKYVSATIAPGGVGKSTLTITDAVAMASGKPLLGLKPHGALRVWLWNGEDPRDEIERRVIATCLHHDIDPDEIAGKLFIDSGRQLPIKIGELQNGKITIATPVVDALVEAIRDLGVDVLIIDPFVSVHSLPENDNGAMDAAVKAFALVADRTGCAIDLVHHSRKLNGVDADIDAARGGSAIAGAVRAARVLNVMSGEVAKTFAIAESDRRSYVRVDDAKANLAPPSAARWFKLSGEPLGNATSDRPEDFVAVAEAWTPPDKLEGIGADELLAVQKAVHEQCYREHFKANEWAGHAVGRVLGLNSRADPGQQKIKNAIKAWIASGALVIDTAKDSKGNLRPIIEVGEWADAS